MADMLSAALAYAELGWPVFPCTTDDKVPLTPHGCKDGTTNPAAVTAWWTRSPRANIAIACGHPGPDVVDFDVKDGAPARQTYERLRSVGLLRGAHLIVATPSGGWHMYYAGTDQRNGAMKRHGVDFRSAGGYVLAPGSVVNGKPYVVTGSRPATGATVSWRSIRDLLDPPRPLPVSTGWGGRAGRRLEALLRETVAPGGRSERFMALVGIARRDGLSEPDAVRLLEPWCEVHHKYVGRVASEVARVWPKVSAP